jgi:SAM-dependent methyltransferase
MAREETLEVVQRESRERLYPPVTNPNWLILRKRREIFQKWLADIPGENFVVLDVGGRIQPYRPLLEGRLQKYVSCDLRRTPLVNIVADAAQIPLATSSFDLVLCNQMLEYVSQPSAVIAEIYRVLKPGGWLLLSVPAVFPRDAEADAWRFLPASLRILLASFAAFEIAPEGSSIAGFFRTIAVCLDIFARPRALRTVSRFTLVPLLNLAGYALEFLFRSSNDQFTANFSVLARK